MLSQEDKKELKEMMVGTFVEGFDQVVVPAMNEMKKELKGEIKEMRGEISELSTKVDSLDRKLWKITDKLGDKIDDHEKRLVIVEKKVVFC